jgi:cell division protein FtsW
MMSFSRTDHSVLGRWWWTVDRWALLALFLIAGIGVVLVQAASPSVAARIGVNGFHFIERHLLVLIPSLALMLTVSMLPLQSLRRFAFVMFFLALIGVILTLFIGQEIKGATRWLHFPGLSMQPSEFLKPAFAVVAAWLFAKQRTETGTPGIPIAIGLYGLVVLLLMSQPDMGQTFVITCIFGGQFLLAGLPIILVAVLIVMGMCGIVGAYFLFPHVQRRVNIFLNPEAGDNYQVARSLEAFQQGGTWGVGPGQGRVKMSIPDSHADFIFSVAGEELGMVSCIIIVGLFAFVALRCFGKASKESNLFVALAISGLAIQFGLQALINMGSTLHLIPTKGMTLPLISYGGSSMIAISIGMGMALALTRKRFGQKDGA